MAGIERAAFVPHNYKAEALWSCIEGYTTNGLVDVRLSPTSARKDRILPFYQPWKDLLFLHDISSRLDHELSVSALDQQFAYYFLVGPVAQAEQENWQQWSVYTDKDTYLLSQRYKIENGFRIMPNLLYDLAMTEVGRLSEMQDNI